MGHAALQMVRAETQLEGCKIKEDEMNLDNFGEIMDDFFKRESYPNAYRYAERNN